MPFRCPPWCSRAHVSLIQERSASELRLASRLLLLLRYVLLLQRRKLRGAASTPKGRKKGRRRRQEWRKKSHLTSECPATRRPRLPNPSSEVPRNVLRRPSGKLSATALAQKVKAQAHPVRRSASKRDTFHSDAGHGFERRPRLCNQRASLRQGES